ncbi:hypothetical protein Tco_0816592 [Tanacetum coccineum]
MVKRLYSNRKNFKENRKLTLWIASITKGKDEVVKEEETEVPEREAFVKDKVKDASSKSEIGVDAIPTATKPPTIVNWKIISQSSQKAAYQIIRKDEVYDRVLWGNLKIMFDPPLSDDAIWSLPLQQKIINWSKAWDRRKMIKLSVLDSGVFVKTYGTIMEAGRVWVLG